MKLILYSGGQERSNQRLHTALVELAISPKRPAPTLSMAYIPFCSDGAERFYARFVRRYRAFGVTDFTLLPIDPAAGRRIDPQLRRQALRSDIVYLAGGNTFYFLKHLRDNGMLEDLRAFVRRGGVLAGLSAGALIISPNIRLAGIPSFDRDDNDVGLRGPKALSALGLVGFEFFPHFRHTRRLREELTAYSRRTPNPILGCADGHGIIVDGDEWSATGPVEVFYRGGGFTLAVDRRRRPR